MKQELLNSLQDNDDVEEKGLKERSNKVSNSQEATIIIRRYEDIIKTQIKKSWVENFLLSWEFSLKLRISLRVENFLLELKIFPRLENFPQELRIFSLTWDFFSLTAQKISASVVSGTVEKEDVYRANIFDSLRSLCLVL